jgi:hypothetical protein
VEHDDKLTCSNCLRKQQDPEQAEASGFRITRPMFGAGFGLLFAWWIFYALAQLALLIPSGKVR